MEKTGNFLESRYGFCFLFDVCSPLPTKKGVFPGPHGTGMGRASCIRACLRNMEKKGNESMNRYSAKNTLVPVNFRYVDPKAKQVKLIGDFNGWDQEAHVMQRTPDGAWFLQLSIHSGHHRYLYLVDGEPMLDPQANGVTQSDEGIRVSLMMVS